MKRWPCPYANLSSNSQKVMKCLSSWSVLGLAFLPTLVSLNNEVVSSQTNSSYLYLTYKDNKDKGSKLGKAVLIHGCRYEEDFAYKSRVEGGLSEGLLTDLWPAYSRKQSATPMHVQDIIAV
jgi:hypothetical protein